MNTVTLETASMDFIYSRPSVPGVFENTVSPKRDSKVGATAINPKKYPGHHSDAGHPRQHKFDRKRYRKHAENHTDARHASTRKVS